MQPGSDRRVELVETTVEVDVQTLVHGIEPEEAGRMLIPPRPTRIGDSDAEPVSAHRGEAAAARVPDRR